MDNKGFILTMDSILAIIVTFILVGSIIHVLTLKPQLPSMDREKHYDAEDIMELLATYDTGNGTILERISRELDSHQQDDAILAAKEIVSGFLDPRFPGLKYNLTENDDSGPITIASNGDMSKADDIKSAIRNYNNHTFQLYIW